MKQVILNIPDGKFEFFMELFQNLGIKTASEVDFPSMTDEEIIQQALQAEAEITQGKTTAHDQLQKAFKKW